MDNTINQTIIEKVAIKSVAIYKAIAMLPPPEIKDLWAEKNSTDQKVNLTRKEEFVKENSITETKTDSTPKDWRDITDPKLRRKMYLKAYNKDYNKDYRATNKNKLNKYSKAYYESNKVKIQKRHRVYRQNNKDKANEYAKSYRETNKDKINKYNRNRKKTDVQYKLSKNLRIRLNKALKRNTKSGSAVEDLGCSIEVLKSYLESKFLPGMSWDNWSKDGWHIDHIKPLASFDLTDHKQLLEACHYTNLQPLWAKDNLSKGDKIN